MVANPDREKIIAQLDKLVAPLPDEVVAYLKYWTPNGWQETLLSDWQRLVLRLLLDKNRDINKPTPTRKAQRLQIITTQAPGNTPYGVYAFSIRNDGDATGEVDGQPLKPDAIITAAATDGNFLISTSYDPKGQPFQISLIIDAELPAPTQETKVILPGDSITFVNGAKLIVNTDETYRMLLSDGSEYWSSSINWISIKGNPTKGLATAALDGTWTKQGLTSDSFAGNVGINQAEYDAF